MPPKFDMQKAHGICRRLPKYMMGVTASKEEAEAAKMLPAALDEIERLQAAMDGWKLDAKRMAENADYWCNEATIGREKHKTQAKCIAELEADKSYWHDVSGKQMRTVEQQHSKICKQRAALRKLGQAKRARGKALVEERARRIALDDLCPEGGCLVSKKQITDWMSGLQIIQSTARGQLRQEGKL